ncbi:ethanolamine utilization protein EutQ [Pseudomonas asiatica]|jgi:ethanolamine utilization protein EutQ|uniref:ethanolamine utilization protein EutQ n=1 Tax=Pseudomonas TaxID=286 RepID=UPI00057F3514|nr:MULTISPECIES: ethanolamine utilization protein EutQ [Pseudomonas]KIC84477.1 ethanolamine utilization protein EutQ [Pseudomonas sp. C5pp]MCE0851742.1 ethanolamine utilization protein EutQ [Pseudomonas asiatica]
MSRAPSGKGPVRLVDHRDLDFVQRGGPPGDAWVARAISNEVSPNLGIGFARWEGAEVAWTVLYDEVIFVIEGCFELQANGEVYRVSPGQVLWIPEGTALVYAGHALFGYVVYPGDWKQRHGLA